jgi:hypothetical protein
MVCPLCGQRKARRACPALGRQICAVCCGTKRLTEIHCPSDCPYLATAREHPPAALVRQQQRDFGLFVQFTRDFSERQSQLFLMTCTFLARYESPELHQVLDDDIAAAAAALASTFETAARGVIYEHRPASPPAERLATALKPLLLEAGQHGGTAFEREAASVLRRIEEAVRDVRAIARDERRGFLDLVGRVIQGTDASLGSDKPGMETPRLIIP